MPSGTRPDAGLLVGAEIPVFLRINGALSRTTAAAISAGDRVQVWRQASVAYGLFKRPPEHHATTRLRWLLSDSVAERRRTRAWSRPGGPTRGSYATWSA